MQNNPLLTRQTYLQTDSLTGQQSGACAVSLPFSHLESSPAPPQATLPPGPWEEPARPPGILAESSNAGPGVFPVGSPDSRYIRVETCMFMIKLPQYSSLEIMLEKLRCAIHYREDPLSG